MRVTSNNMMNSYLKDVQKNLQGMNKINNQISTGNQVNKVSDDPLKAVKIMNLNMFTRHLGEQQHVLSEL